MIWLCPPLGRPGPFRGLLPSAIISGFTPCRTGWDFTAGLEQSTQGLVARHGHVRGARPITRHSSGQAPRARQGSTEHSFSSWLFPALYSTSVKLS